LAAEKKGVALKEQPLFLRGMYLFNRVIHSFLGISLVVIALLTLWLFMREICVTLIYKQKLVEGLLHALGTLLILWTVSELITTEIRYLAGHRLQVAVFVDVAIAATVRKILIADIEQMSLELRIFHLAALVGLGVIRWLLTCAVVEPEGRARQPGEKPPA